MTSSRGKKWWRALSPRERLAAMAVTLGVLAVAGIARLLHPDPRGLGTHEQLGLPPCMMTVIFHIPCPFCGMTTAFSLVIHGRFMQALRVQPAGCMAACFAITLGLASLLFAIIGKGPMGILSPPVMRWLGWVLMIGILAAWIYKIIITQESGGITPHLWRQFYTFM